MRRLYRSTRDRKLFGVCGGLAEYLGIDPTLLRILLIVVAVFSAGSVVLVYIIAGFVIPREPVAGGPFSADSFGGATGGWRPYEGGWAPPPRSPGASGSQSWSPDASWTGAGPAAAPRPEPGPRPQATSSASTPLDAMMEDIEKKALKKEIDELKQRITKFEQQSKGE